MTTNATPVEMRELNHEEIDAVGGGFLGHAAVIGAVGLLCVALLAAKSCSSGSGGGAGEMET